MTQPTLPRSLSEREARLLSQLSAAGQRIFTIHDAHAILGEEGGDARKLLHRLCAKRWVERLERGKYLIIPLEAGPKGDWAAHEYLVAASLVEPYYLAYGTALNYHGYTERLPRPIWVAPTKRKRSLTIAGVEYRFVTLVERKFFGHTAIELLDSEVQMAEREKAIADGFDHPGYCGGVVEAAKGLWFGNDELDFEKLAVYSQRLGNRAATQRLGFWLELLDVGDAALQERLEKPQDRNYAKLDPRGPARGPRNARWRLIINVPERQLLEWREH